MSRASLEANMGQTRKSVWGLKNEEYTADFCLVSRRSLSLREHRLFRFHYLLGADWKLCCRKLEMDRGAFFHEAYRIEQKLGRVFRELEPHALFPVDEYFNGTGRYDRHSALSVLNSFAVEEPEDSEEERGDEAETGARRRYKNVLKFPIRRAA
jgi:hypothetical protein